MTQTIINALFGGLLIGVAVSLMLLFNGRVTGISGIVNGLITPQKGDTVWRVFFVLGLLLGGLYLSILMPGSLINTLPTSNGMIFFCRTSCWLWNSHGKWLHQWPWHLRF